MSIVQRGAPRLNNVKKLYYRYSYKGYKKYVQQNPVEESLPFCICGSDLRWCTGDLRH